MILKASTFVPAPIGVHNAVCVDFFDLGIVDTQYGKKQKCCIVFQTEQKMPAPDNKPYLVSQRFNVSLGPKSTLKKFLVSWRGREFTTAELKGFETENVVGACAQIVVVHNEKAGEIYANIGTILKAIKKIAPDGSYVRFKDRQKATQEPHPAEAAAADAPDEPF